MGVRDCRENGRDFFKRLKLLGGMVYGTLDCDGAAVDKLRIGAVFQRVGRTVQAAFDRDPCGFLLRETARDFHVIVPEVDRHSIVVYCGGRYIWDGFYLNVLRLAEESIRMVTGWVGQVANRRVEGAKLMIRRVMWLR